MKEGGAQMWLTQTFEQSGVAGVGSKRPFLTFVPKGGEGQMFGRQL